MLRIFFAIDITPCLARLERLPPLASTALSNNSLSTSERFKVKRGFNWSLSGVLGRPLLVWCGLVLSVMNFAGMVIFDVAILPPCQQLYFVGKKTYSIVLTRLICF
jgi:hypothetical protein